MEAARLAGGGFFEIATAGKPNCYRGLGAGANLRVGRRSHLWCTSPDDLHIQALHT
jgi:hypothetical protein